MKWRTPRSGETRERMVFAWRPIECDDGFTRWLEPVRITEKYTQNILHGYYWRITSARSAGVAPGVVAA